MPITSTSSVPTGSSTEETKTSERPTTVSTSSVTTTTSTTVVTTTTSPPTTGTTTVMSESTRSVLPPTTGTTTTASTTVGTTTPTSSASTTRTSPRVTKSTTATTSTSAGTTTPTSSASTTRTSPLPTTGTTTITSTRAGITTAISIASTTKTTSPPTTGTTTITSESTTKTIPPPTKDTYTTASTSVQSTVPSSSVSTTLTTPVIESTASTIFTSTQSTAATSSSATTKTSPTLSRNPTTIATIPTNSPSTSKTTSSGRESTVPTSTSSLPSSSTTLSPTAISTGVTQTIAQSSTSRSSAGTSQTSHSTSTSTVFISSPTTPSTTESSETTPCFCHVLGDLFSPGEVVYNRTDKAGCNFYALCSSECEIAPFQGPCPTTTPLTTVSTETTTQASSSTEYTFSSASPTAISLTTPLERNCTDVSPPRKPGEKWTSECQECECDSLTATAHCQPRLCTRPREVVCGIGFVALPLVPVKDLCCPELECQPRTDICEIDDKIYEIGTSVIHSCKNCTCSSEKNILTGKRIMKCEPLKCETSCLPGYEYRIEDGECCGKCYEKACRIQLNNETVVLEVGKTLPIDPCSHYKCELIEDQYVKVQSKKVCPEYGPAECDPDEAETTADGCCKICKPPNCKTYSKKTVIQHEDCESSEAVELTYCEGTCPGSSMYSLKANQMQHDCTCCQELSSHRREVTLNCQNGTSINYSYVYVDQCQCINACNPQTIEADDYQSKISQTLV
ncbi:mucin-5AC-like [Coturnix japonica]|uniref:mucin-5AC-like n=1 Tax=Coturnix japonica TaxID=93934 RepID=UPI000776CCF8|nr:mucin-5AC-like [Coturnix japonica]